MLYQATRYIQAHEAYGYAVAKDNDDVIKAMSEDAVYEEYHDMIENSSIVKSKGTRALKLLSQEITQENGFTVIKAVYKITEALPQRRPVEYNEKITMRGHFVRKDQSEPATALNTNGFIVTEYTTAKEAIGGSE